MCACQGTAGARQERGGTAPTLRPEPAWTGEHPWHDPRKCQSQKSKTDSRTVPDRRGDSEKWQANPSRLGLDPSAGKDIIGAVGGAPPGPWLRRRRSLGAGQNPATRERIRDDGKSQKHLVGGVVRLATHSFLFSGTNSSFYDTSNFPVSLSLFEKQTWFLKKPVHSILPKGWDF